jgi:ubiquitin C-terminal hydrolase
MSTPSSYIEIAFSSIKVFSDDGQLDLQEFNFLLGLALRDQHVDEDEKRVLGNVFRQAEKSPLNLMVRKRIADARKVHGIPA